MFRVCVTRRLLLTIYDCDAALRHYDYDSLDIALRTP